MPTASNYFVYFLRTILNTLIPRGGDGNLLHELQFFEAETREVQNKSVLPPFFIIGFGLIAILRYLLGHTLANILTLQSVYIRSSAHRYNDNPEIPLSRHVFGSLALLYAHQGLRILTKGLYVAAIYHLVKIAVTKMLKEIIFRPTWTHLAADIVATVLLSETHMRWTHATISSSKGSWRVRLLTHNHQRLAKLALPSAAQRIAVVLLDWASKFSTDLGDASNSDVWRILSVTALVRVFVALIIRSFVLAPASAWLTLVELGFLNPSQETLVYEEGKGRFMNLGVVVAGYQQQRSPWKAWNGVSLSLCLWLLELHVKKCAVLVVFWELASSILLLIV